MFCRIYTHGVSIGYICGIFARRVYLYISVGFLHAVCSDCIGNAKTSDSGMDSGRKNPRFSFVLNQRIIKYLLSDFGLDWRITNNYAFTI